MNRHHDNDNEHDEPFRPTVHSQADLEQVWRFLIRPLGFSRRSVWMLLIDPERRAIPRITEITECDTVPDAETGAGFAHMLSRLNEDFPGGSFAFLLSRPGRSAVAPDDRAWATFLLDATRTAGLRAEVVHLATDDDIVPLPLDEIGLARPA